MSGEHTMRITCVLVIAVAFVAVKADQEYAGVRVAMKVYDECSKADAFSPCLKKKAFTILDRLGRMDKLNIAEGISVVRADDAPAPAAPVSEEELDKTLPRSVDARDAALNDMLVSKVASLIGSRTVKVSFPEVNSISRSIEEGRGKMKKMMGGMMMGIAAKMAALVPVAIAGLFLLAGKALITAKIALLISGIIALKKLLAKKEHGGGGGGHGWQSGGGGGGWDKRAFDEAQKLAYKGYAPQ